MPLERVPRDESWLLEDDKIRALGEQFLVVRDDFLDAETVRAARAEIEALAADEKLRPAGISRGQSYRHEAKVRGDLITWLDAEDASPALAEVHERFEQLRRELNAAAYLGLGYFEVQIAWYPGGGTGYERHLDAFGGSPNRKMTAIVYLNESWQPDQGGLLRAWLPEGTVREIEPRAGRLVVFASDRVPHAVLPTHAPRCAVTAWYRPRGVWSI